MIKKYVLSALLCVAPAVKADVTCLATQMHNADRSACVPLTCPAPKQLNLTKTACFTPPTCTAPDTLNATQTACIKPKALVCTPPKILNVSKITCIDPIVPQTVQNTKPTLGALQQEWDVNVGDTLTLALSVNDAQRDDFTMHSTTMIGRFGEAYVNADNVPTVDFLFTPIAEQGNKVYATAFTARETKTTQHYVSNKVAVKIRVWPSANRESDAILKLSVLRVRWQADRLTLEGQAVFNTLLTQEERDAFIKQQFELIISAPDSRLLNTTPLALDNQGFWRTAFALPRAQTPCSVVLEFNTHKVTHPVTHAPLDCGT